MLSPVRAIARNLPEPVKAVLRPLYRRIRAMRQERPPAAVVRPLEPVSDASTTAADVADAPAQVAEEYVYPWAGIPHPPDTVSDDVYFRHYSTDALDNRRFYNIGAGTFRHRFWTNIDLATEHYAGQQMGSDFINHDLLSLAPFPIESGKAEVCYTSHTVEHVQTTRAPTCSTKRSAS